MPDFHLAGFLGNKRNPANSAQTSHHINPRFRAYGKARMDIARRIQSQEDWDNLWITPKNPFAISFPWQSAWKQCIEYRVDDYAAEVGFWIDVIGVAVNAFGPEYAQFSGYSGEFTFAVSAAYEGMASTPADSIRMQFMVEDLLHTVDELTRRNVIFEQPPIPVTNGSPVHIATFRTPHGIAVDLWGEITVQAATLTGSSQVTIISENQDNQVEKFTIEENDPSLVGETGITHFQVSSDVRQDADDQHGPIWKLFEDSSVIPNFQYNQASQPVTAQETSQKVNREETNQKKADPVGSTGIPFELAEKQEKKPGKLAQVEYIDEITYEPLDDIAAG